jgi:hypothetical protein
VYDVMSLQFFIRRMCCLCSLKGVLRIMLMLGLYMSWPNFGVSMTAVRKVYLHPFHGFVRAPLVNAVGSLADIGYQGPSRNCDICAPDLFLCNTGCPCICRLWLKGSSLEGRVQQGQGSFRWRELGGSSYRADGALQQLWRQASQQEPCVHSGWQPRLGG